MEAFMSRMLRHEEGELGEEDASVLELTERYMEVVRSLGRYDEVEHILEQELARAERDLGPEDLGTLKAVEKLADCRTELGKNPKDVLPLRKRILAGRTKFMKKTDKEYYIALTGVYNCLVGLNQMDEADSILGRMERWE